MHPKNITDPHHMVDHYTAGIPYASANVPSSFVVAADSHCYQSQSQSQHPSSLIYDPASSYINYSKDEGDMYPTMSMMPGMVVDTDLQSNNNNGHFANGEYTNNDPPHYQQQRSYSTHDSNLMAGHSSHFIPRNNGMPTYSQSHTLTHNEGNSQPAHFADYAQSRKRHMHQDLAPPTNPAGYGYNVNAAAQDLKQPKTDKASKGLRHFSMKVCEKVQQKKITTYNEVADELVHEFGESDKGPGNEQNIRRRVYDALNVLMAMNIISKDKKEIRWLGLPSNSAQEHQRLQNEGIDMYESIKAKLKTIYELIIQNLISYNKKHENEAGYSTSPDKCIQLPFLAITTSQNTDVICRINDQKNKYDISFSSDFELNDDSEILRRLGFSCNLESPSCTPKDLKRSLQMVPPNLSYYVRAMAGRSVAEFQEHVLSNRGYLGHDDVMEFYNRINRSVFESVPNNNSNNTYSEKQFSAKHSPPNEHQNVDKLNSNSVGHYTYNHNSPFPHHEHSGSNSNNDRDSVHPFESATNETYSLSSPLNTTTNIASPNSNDAPHLNSKETFVQAEHQLTHMTNDNNLSTDSINHPGYDRL